MVGACTGAAGSGETGCTGAFIMGACPGCGADSSSCRWLCDCAKAAPHAATAAMPNAMACRPRLRNIGAAPSRPNRFFLLGGKRLELLLRKPVAIIARRRRHALVATRFFLTAAGRSGGPAPQG